MSFLNSVEGLNMKVESGERIRDLEISVTERIRKVTHQSLRRVSLEN